jgi:hypothetical protein
MPGAIGKYLIRNGAFCAEAEPNHVGATRIAVVEVRN